MTRKPAFAPHSAHFDKHENSHLTLSIFHINEAISLVAIRSKSILIGPNHATVKLGSSVAPRGMKTYSESKIETRNLQILKKMLEK